MPMVAFRPTFVQIGLLMIIFFGVFFIQQNLVSHSQEPKQIVSHDKKQMDEYLYHATLTQFDERGRLIKRLHLDSWEHSPVTQMGQFTAPMLTLYGETDTWEIKADTGQAPQAHLGEKLDTLELKDNVSIKNAPAKGTPWLLVTPHLWFYLNENRSETNAPVTITQSFLTIKGIGAKANLEQGIIKLKQDVKTTYVHPTT